MMIRSGSSRCVSKPAFVLLCLVAATSGSHASSRAQAPQPEPAEITDRRIQQLIQGLGDPAYSTRAEATRALCMIGQRAAPALKLAATGREFEVALRARELLEVIESVYFAGCGIELSAEKNKITWDEPLALTLRIRNRSGYPAQLPFELSSRVRAELPESVRQVGDMMDLAEYLRVISPDGRQIALRVDDIRADPLVMDAVEWRTEGGPVARLAAGKEAQVLMERFNRGWARFPMLSRGVYKIVFDYQPQWDDEEFRRAGVGRLRGNVLEIEVTSSAPRAVRHSRHPILMSLERDEGELVARLTNADDLPIWVNLNLQSAEPPFAQLSWVIAAGDSVEEVGKWNRLEAALDRFRRDRVVKLVPGGTLELGRTRVDILSSTDLVRGLPEGSSFRVRANWVNLCDVSWQRAERASLPGDPRGPGELAAPLPRRMTTGRFGSAEIELIKGR